MRRHWPLKKLPLNLTALKEAVTVRNIISSWALNSWLFSKLYKAVGSDHNKLLHAEVRWPARGRVLRRMGELNEVKLFLR
jgi:hypothetical protein